MKIDITCNNCGATFRVAEKYAGKRVKCSFCDKRITVPNTAGSSSTQTCRQCHSKMTAGSVICIECGYDLRSNKKVSDQHQPTNDRPARVRNQQAFLLLAGVAGGIILLCLGLYAFIKSEKKKQKEEYAEQTKQANIREQDRRNAEAALENDTTLKEPRYNLTCKKRLLELAKDKIENSAVWTVYFAQASAKPVHFRIALKRTTFKNYSFA